MKNRVPLTALLALALTLVLVQPARAYIDPGSGSYVFQILIATAIGLAYSIRLYWDRLKSFIASVIAKKPENP